LKKLTVFLLAVVLSWSCALPVYAKHNKVKLRNPEARAALKRNKALQRKMKKLAKSRDQQIKYLQASRKRPTS